MPCCKQNWVAVFHTEFILVNSKSKKYAATQLFKSLETHLLWILPYSLEVEINDGFWSANSKNHFEGRFPKDWCSNFLSFLLLMSSACDLSSGIFTWRTGERIYDFVGDFGSRASSTYFTLWYGCLSTGHRVHEYVVLQLMLLVVYQKQHLKATPLQCGICQTWRETAEWKTFFQLQGWKTLGRAWAFGCAACPFSALCQRALLIITSSWKKAASLAAFMGTNKAFHSVPAAEAAPGDRQLRRFAHPWVREGGTPSRNRKVVAY